MIRSIIVFGAGFGLGYWIRNSVKAKKENEKIQFEVQVPNIDDLNTFQISALKEKIDEKMGRDEKQKQFISFEPKKSNSSNNKLLSNQPEQVKTCKGLIQPA